MTRVLIAEDSVLLRAGLAAVLRDAGMTIVGNVDHIDGLLATAAATAPDVALVNLATPGTRTDHGPPAVGLMRLLHPQVAVLALSAAFDPELTLRLLTRRPVRMGYLLTQPLPDSETLLRAVRVIATGGTFIDRAAIQRLGDDHERPDLLQQLSEREREILTLMSDGRTNRAIGATLSLSPKTVETHVRAIFSKLGLRPAADEHRRVLAVLRYIHADRALATNNHTRHNTPGHSEALARTATVHA